MMEGNKYWEDAVEYKNKGYEYYTEHVINIIMAQQCGNRDALKIMLEDCIVNTHINYKKLREFIVAENSNKGGGIIEYVVGLLHYVGLGVSKDYPAAREYLNIAIEKGNVNAIAELGDMYYQGKYFDKNISKSIELWKDAVEKGSYMGSLYLSSYYIFDDKNPSKALEYIKKLKGNSYYYKQLVRLYTDKKEYEKALEYCELMLKDKTADSFIQMGSLYQYGRGVEQNDLRAIEYYLKAIEKGSYEGCTHLGIIYYNKKEYLKAIEYFEKAARYCEYAQYLLGIMYSDGKGVEQDYLKALEYFEMSDYDGVYEEIGHVYYFGRGVEQDYEKALEYYLRAPKDDIGCFIGDIYSKKGDSEKAIEYFSKSADKGVVWAMDALGNLYSEKGDWENGLKYYKMSLKTERYCDSACSLSLIYLNECKNYRKAIKYARIALELSNDAEIHGVATHIVNNMDRTGIIGILIDTNKEHNKTISELKNRILEYRSKINELEDVLRSIHEG